MLTHALTAPQAASHHPPGWRVTVKLGAFSQHLLRRAQRAFCKSASSRSVGVADDARGEYIAMARRLSRPCQRQPSFELCSLFVSQENLLTARARCDDTAHVWSVCSVVHAVWFVCAALLLCLLYKVDSVGSATAVWCVLCVQLKNFTVRRAPRWLSEKWRSPLP